MIGSNRLRHLVGGTARIGVLLGQETRRRGCRVLLAPTVNIHRSPLAGRNFECYSEDPLLSGTLAAAYIRGVQSQDVATTVKPAARRPSRVGSTRPLTAGRPPAGASGRITR